MAAIVNTDYALDYDSRPQAPIDLSTMFENASNVSQLVINIDSPQEEVPSQILIDVSSQSTAIYSDLIDDIRIDEKKSNVSLIGAIVETLIADEEFIKKYGYNLRPSAATRRIITQSLIRDIVKELRTKAVYTWLFENQFELYFIVPWSKTITNLQSADFFNLMREFTDNISNGFFNSKILNLVRP